MTTQNLPGILLRAPASCFGDKVYYAARGRRHWIRDGSWLARHGYRWPHDVHNVEPEVLYAFRNGGNAPLRSSDDTPSRAMGSVDLREIAAAGLTGTGIEFGAGASPYPVPLGCHVLYADAIPYTALLAGMYPGQTLHDLVIPDFITDIQSLSGIADASLDFIVACHVIEHTTDPIAALKACHRALKTGGALVLVVPDMTKTFDKERQLTPLSHLIEDHQNPSRDRDRAHYLEFYCKAFNIPAGISLEDYAARQHDIDYSIHFHTWNYESFRGLVTWVDQEMHWSNIWSHPTLGGAEDIEFYFTLKK